MHFCAVVQHRNAKKKPAQETRQAQCGADSYRRYSEAKETNRHIFVGIWSGNMLVWATVAQLEFYQAVAQRRE